MTIGDSADRDGLLKAEADILLLNPPFSRPEEPVISIPALASFLRSRDRNVAAFDLNREFFCRFLTPGNILKGKTYALKRFKELNERPGLKIAEMMEYIHLFQVVGLTSKYRTEIALLQTGFPDFNDIQQQSSAVRNFYIQLASTPYFPEFAFHIRYPSFSCGFPFHFFSSSDVIESIQRPGLYSEIVRECLEELLDEKLYRIIGISISYYNQIIPAFYCARVIKEIAPTVHITMGGTAILIFFRELKEKRIFNFIDSLVMDEGEIPLDRLITELTTNSPDLSRVPGLVYLEDGDIHRNEHVSPPPMKNLPVPDYNVFQLDKYLTKRDQVLIPFRAAKGCPWGRCTFCRTKLPAIHSYQQSSTDLVFERLRQVIRETGTSRIHFADESIDANVLEDISKKILAEGIKIDWQAQTRMDRSLTKRRCKLYRDAGCTSLSLGVETFSDRILRLMDKGITAQMAEDVIKELDGFLPLSIFMIVGFPTQTETEARYDFERVIHLLKRGLISEYHYSMFAIYSSSAIYAKPQKFGIENIPVPESWDLSPDILEFEGQGMTRKKMRELYLRFTQNRTSAFNKVEALRVFDEDIGLNFDLREIQRRIHAHSVEHPPVPYCDWLRADGGYVLSSKRAP